MLQQCHIECSPSQRTENQNVLLISEKEFSTALELKLIETFMTTTTISSETTAHV
jgi:hypothetical protein